MAAFTHRILYKLVTVICGLLITHMVLWFILHHTMSKSKVIQMELESHVNISIDSLKRDRLYDKVHLVNNVKHKSKHKDARKYKHFQNKINPPIEKYKSQKEINTRHLIDKQKQVQSKQFNIKKSPSGNNMNILKHHQHDHEKIKLLHVNKSKIKKSHRYFKHKKHLIQREKVVKDNQLLSGHKLETFIKINNIPNVHLTHINCKALSEGDTAELKKAMQYQLHHYKIRRHTKELTQLASNCSEFLRRRHYTMVPLSTEEASFPIAYSLVVYTDVEQVEKLLRAIYRPQNYYCIHIDKKASRDLWQAMHAIVACFDNVFILPKSVEVTWGTYSVLEPELMCMETLWKYKWKYFINLTGQEFPLQTNSAIVKILKAFNGSNNVEGTAKGLNVIRLRYVHNGTQPNYDVLKPAAPLDIRFTKGSVHAVLQRGFVDQVLHNEDVLAFREWVKDTGFPEETFFSSLNYSPQLNIPGAYKGEAEIDKIDEGRPRNPFVARFKNWGEWPFNWPCAGMRLRNVCIFGVGDLPLLVKRRELFANKFLMDYQPLVYDCLEEIHFNKTREELLGQRKIDAEFYQKLDFVKNHV